MTIIQNALYTVLFYTGCIHQGRSYHFNSGGVKIRRWNYFTYIDTMV